MKQRKLLPILCGALLLPVAIMAAPRQETFHTTGEKAGSVNEPAQVDFEKSDLGMLVPAKAAHHPMRARKYVQPTSVSPSDTDVAEAYDEWSGSNRSHRNQSQQSASTADDSSEILEEHGSVEQRGAHERFSTTGRY